MDNNKITFEQISDPAYRRAVLMKDKRFATSVIFDELRGIINPGKFSEVYLERVPSWFEHRLAGQDTNREKTRFTAEEYDMIATSFRDLANRLNAYADELDAAEINPE